MIGGGAKCEFPVKIPIVKPFASIILITVPIDISK